MKLQEITEATYVNQQEISFDEAIGPLTVWLRQRREEDKLTNDTGEWFDDMMMHVSDRIWEQWK